MNSSTVDMTLTTTELKHFLDRLPPELVTHIFTLLTSTTDPTLLAKLVRLSKSTHDKLISELYYEVELNKDNVDLFFRGLGSKFDGSEPADEMWTRDTRPDDVLLHGKNRETLVPAPTRAQQGNFGLSSFRRKHALINLYTLGIHLQDYEALVRISEAIEYDNMAVDRSSEEEVKEGIPYLLISVSHISFCPGFFVSIPEADAESLHVLGDITDIFLTDSMCIHLPSSPFKLSPSIWRDFVAQLEANIQNSREAKGVCTFNFHNVGPGYNPSSSNCLFESQVRIFLRSDDECTTREQRKTISHDLKCLANDFRSRSDLSTIWNMPEYYNFLGAEDPDFDADKFLEETFPQGVPEGVGELARFYGPSQSGHCEYCG